MDMHNFEEYLDLRDQQDTTGGQSNAQELPIVSSASDTTPALITNTSTVNQDSWTTTTANLGTEQMEHYLFPLDGTNWNVLTTSAETTTAATQGQAPVAAPSLTEMSHFIPPHFLMPMQGIEKQLLSSEQQEQQQKEEEGTGEGNKNISGTISLADLTALKGVPDEEQKEEGIMTRSRRRSAAVKNEEDEKPPAATPVSSTTKKSRKKLYCICRQPYNGDPMVQCDGCNDWFHCTCVQLDPDEAEDIDWVCPTCDQKTEEVNEEPPVEIKETPTRIQKTYSSRQSKNVSGQAKCLLPSCHNRTRADSYCSDVCARQHATQMDDDPEYVPVPEELHQPPSVPSTSEPGPSEPSTSEPSTSEPSTSEPSTSEPKRQHQKISSISASPKEPTPPPTVSTPEPISTDAEDNPVRKNVIKSMTNILKPIIENTLEKQPSMFEDVPDKSAEEMAEELAKSIEDGMYSQLSDPPTREGKLPACGERYKSKFRSLLYNLKDKANEMFQIRVITGALSPDELVKMSSEDMANPELKSMSESLREKSIKNSVLKVQNMPIIKKTHKGDIIMIATKDGGYAEERPTNAAETPEPPVTKPVERISPMGSRKSSLSSMSITPTARPSIVEDILSRMGMDTDSSRQDLKRQAIERDTPAKRRKTELEVEALLGDSDVEFTFDSDIEESESKQEEDQPPSIPKPPIIWNGRVNMPNVAEFDAMARQIGGRTLTEPEWAEVLSPTMWIEGRIPTDRVTSYVTQTQYSNSREIVLLEIEATSENQVQTLLHYFDSRKRYGVVGHNKTKIKDFYLIPLYKTQQIPDCLYVVRVEETQRDCDLFLGVLVLTKQADRPLTSSYQMHEPYVP
ncbi:PHD finger protein 3 [Apophysomyces sp. BC1034]|nr:PHD finger protein 3 [Apophysomyces sp. BC1015]KAG0170211.1 PHD finger protein 3 [Apophysomyces sp. BC1021]KAG0184567.1 PHD finger protein 3 [Apophysomyces sp. BC1034]